MTFKRALENHLNAKQAESPNVRSRCWYTAILVISLFRGQELPAMRLSHCCLRSKCNFHGQARAPKSSQPSVIILIEQDILLRCQKGTVRQRLDRLGLGPLTAHKFPWATSFEWR